MELCTPSIPKSNPKSFDPCKATQKWTKWIPDLDKSLQFHCGKKSPHRISKLEDMYWKKCMFNANPHVNAGFMIIWVWVNTYRYITIVGRTSIYQLFWGSLGTRVLTHPHMEKGSRTIATYKGSRTMQLYDFTKRFLSTQNRMPCRDVYVYQWHPILMIIIWQCVKTLYPW